MRECNCSLRTKLFGDGCQVCNPEYAASVASETILNLEEEVGGLQEQLDQVKSRLLDGCTHYCRWYDEGSPSVNGSHMAYDLVTVMRYVLKDIGPPEMKDGE